MRSTRTEFDAREYFEADEFQAYSLAQDIVDHYPLATTEESNTLYWQNGTVWEDNGEQMLTDDLWKVLGDACSRTRINETLEAVKALSRERRERLLDLPPEKVVVANGVVDLLKPDPDERFALDANGGTFTRVPVEYRQDAYPERFNQFLFEVLPREDVSTMWELIGYCLYRGYPFQKAFMFIGDGANGKSTLLAALRDFLGVENIATAELQTLAGNRFAAADLDGKLANIAPDISDEGLEQTGTFKALTGGDRIRAERKYEQAYHFENHAKLIFSANTVPQADDGTYAYERRWLYFDFPNTFTGEDAVPQRELLAQFREEYPGILNMATVHFQQLWERGGFEDTSFMQANDAAHERATDPTVAFVEDELVPAEGDYVRVKRAWEAFRAWCDEHGHPTQGKQHFKGVVNRVHAPPAGKDPDDGRYTVWLGLRLSDDAAGDTPDSADRDGPGGRQGRL